MRSKILFFLVLMSLGIGLMSQAGTPPEPVDPLNWRVLKSFLESWKDVKIIGEPKGSTVSMGNFKMSQVKATVNMKDVKVKVQIIDGGFAPMFYMGFNTLQNFSIDSSDEYVKKITIKGHPGIEQFRYKRNKGTIMVLVAKRIIVQFECRGCKDTDTLKKLATIPDYSIITKKL